MARRIVGPQPLHVYAIGLKLRALRLAKHLSLARLSSETGLSTALLCKLETERMVPTLRTLERICRSYGIGLGYFFCEPHQHSLAITRRLHVTDRRDGLMPQSIPLHVPTPRARTVSTIVNLPTGISSILGKCGTRTELTAYVLEGALYLTIAGSKEVLELGDCLVVNTDQALVWSAGQDSPCRILTVAATEWAGLKSGDECAVRRVIVNR